MKKKSKIIIGIISLIIITSIIFIAIILNRNTNILKLNQNKEQLTTEDGILSTTEHFEQISEAEEKAYQKGNTEGYNNGYTQGVADSKTSGSLSYVTQASDVKNITYGNWSANPIATCELPKGKYLVYYQNYDYGHGCLYGSEKNNYSHTVTGGGKTTLWNYPSPIYGATYSEGELAIVEITDETGIITNSCWAGGSDTNTAHTYTSIIYVWKFN